MQSVDGVTRLVDAERFKAEILIPSPIPHPFSVHDHQFIVDTSEEKLMCRLLMFTYDRLSHVPLFDATGNDITQLYDHNYATVQLTVNNHVLVESDTLQKCVSPQIIYTLGAIYVLKAIIKREYYELAHENALVDTLRDVLFQ